MSVRFNDRSRVSPLRYFSPSSRICWPLRVKVLSWVNPSMHLSPAFVFSIRRVKCSKLLQVSDVFQTRSRDFLVLPVPDIQIPELRHMTNVFHSKIRHGSMVQ